MGEYALQMRNIVKSFYGNTVLDNVNFDLKKGRVHAIVGGNGAGKSTLMKILTGVYTKDSGEIIVDGKKCDFSNYNDANAAGIRMIFQELSVVPTLTVAENIFLNHEYKKSRPLGMLLDDKKMKKEAEALLRHFELEVPVDAKIRDLSVGLWQLIEIVKALSRKTKVLVMDEPTASLTANEVTRLFDIVKSLKASGVSIVYISHRMNEILSIADEITVLRDGRHIITEEARNLDINGIINYMLGESARHSFEYHERPHREKPAVRLEVENLCVDNLVKDVSFSVNEGEITGIAGLMGSGRTETLEALFGARKIQKGSVKVQGRLIPIKNTRDAINAGIALVPEDRRREGLVLPHTVKINMLITLFKQVTGKILIDEAKIKELTRVSIQELNIKTQSIDSQASSLSGGNQQKIVIAKWLKNNPKLLLLDEPTAGIDIGAKGEIIKIIEDYAQEGNSVIVVSSEIPELMAMCDKIIVMVDGRLTRTLTRNDMLNEEVIQNAIQG
ncbi:MAG: sugar ABC transporter ATP-binding protein [Spirochaetaceae bacterium]|jgi:ribose transport system ATP-binding protein|nr:sugar ABC transporter ATP-binding protein [Spirochaetaceae bacterium]